MLCHSITTVVPSVIHGVSTGTEACLQAQLQAATQEWKQLAASGADALQEAQALRQELERLRAANKGCESSDAPARARHAGSQAAADALPPVVQTLPETPLLWSAISRTAPQSASPSLAASGTSAAEPDSAVGQSAANVPAHSPQAALPTDAASGKEQQALKPDQPVGNGAASPVAAVHHLSSSPQAPASHNIRAGCGAVRPADSIPASSPCWDAWQPCHGALAVRVSQLMQEACSPDPNDALGNFGSENEHYHSPPQPVVQARPNWCTEPSLCDTRADRCARCGLCMPLVQVGAKLYCNLYAQPLVHVGAISLA